jgi:hypothetical protein
MNISTYVMMMNFVNSVQADGMISPAFMATSETAEPPQAQITESAAIVLLALRMHDLDTMGTSLNHMARSLDSWIPNLFRTHCLPYMAAFYQLLTLPEINQKTREELDSALDEIINEYASSTKLKLVEVVKAIKDFNQVRVGHHRLMKPAMEDYSEFKCLLHIKRSKPTILL